MPTCLAPSLISAFPFDVGGGGGWRSTVYSCFWQSVHGMTSGTFSPLQWCELGTWLSFSFSLAELF